MDATHEKCLHVAERAADVWYSNASHATERLDMAVGTVAAMTLIRMQGADSGAVATLWEQLDDTELVAKLHRIWSFRWLEQPYLVETARPLHAWLDDDLDSETLAAVRRVAVATLRAGVLQLTGAEDPACRCDADVLGVVLTHMRAAGARAGLGEFHTPPDVAELIVHMLAAPAAASVITDLPDPGAGIADPAGGTGGLIRAAAVCIRRLGGDPALYRWFMSDINPLAAACSAANAITWGLGCNVLVHCGDTLAHGDGSDQAAVVRRGALAHYATVLRTAQLVALTTPLTASSDEAA